MTIPWSEMALGLLANLKETRKVKWAYQVKATSIANVIKETSIANVIKE